MKLLNAKEAQDEAFIKVLLAGASGAGKTTCASKAPMPLIIEPSPQAITSIRAANPNAQVLLIDSVNDLRTALSALKNAERVEINDLPALKVTIEGQQFVAQTVVLDDLDEIQEFLKRELQGDAATLTQQQWGIILDKNMAILRAFRSLPINFIACAKVISVQNEESQIYKLALYGQKFEPLLPGLFNMMGYQYRKPSTESDPREHVVGFRLPEKYPTKAHPALLSIEEPDPSVWWKKVREWCGSLSSPAPAKESLPSDYKAPVQLGQRQPQRQPSPIPPKR